LLLTRRLGHLRKALRSSPITSRVCVAQSRHDLVEFH
jgi:hypothetical protein